MDDSLTVADIGDAVRHSKEKQTLQRLPPSFYSDVQHLIATLEQQLSSSEPDSRQARMLSDQLTTARRNLEQLFRNRMEKVVRFALMSATSHWEGESSELANMDESEKEVYLAVRDAIVRARRSVVDASTSNTKPAQSPPVPTDEPQPEAGKKTHDDMPPDTHLLSKNNINEEYVVVRTLEAVPTFLGSDGRTYTLGKEDVATIPVANANVLIKRGIAVGVSVGAFQREGER
ncbi:MAG: hypothetical protein ACXQS9_03720 [Methermicoccaceae archaeon]